MFQFLFVATTPPPLDVCFELNIKLAKCLLPPAAHPTPATLVLLQVSLSSVFLAFIAVNSPFGLIGLRKTPLNFHIVLTTE